MLRAAHPPALRDPCSAGPSCCPQPEFPGSRQILKATERFSALMVGDCLRVTGLAGSRRKTRHVAGAEQDLDLPLPRSVDQALAEAQ